jgi:pectin lyase
MKLSLLAAVVAAFASGVSAADAVKGAAEGFAKGVSGGGRAGAVYPKTNQELISYLGDNSPRTIVLTKTFDFRGTEGPGNSDGCKPWGNGATCQIAINGANSWCDREQPKAPKVKNIRYDKAGVNPIVIKSNKSLIGQGSKGVIIGKGVKMVSGAKNIIIQNVRFTNINPQFVWGGDAITINDADMIWIDHVTVDLIGRQQLVLGTQASRRVTVSNCEFNGATSWSATCDGHHYWGMYFTGNNDMITFKNNYVHHMSGRAPKVQQNTLLHAVNNYFYANSGHAFETAAGGNVLAEGNVFQNVKNPLENNGGQIFAAGNGQDGACRGPLGRNCVPNAYGSTPKMPGTSAGFLNNFKGKNIAGASSANDAKRVMQTAGFGRI